MTAAYRFRGVGWFLSGVIVVLGFYLVSLQVAAERKQVDDVSRAIASARRDIRALETEFNTRANLAQLERWNGEVLALTAPNADQFVSDEAALARVDFNHAGTAPQVADVAYVVPAGLPLRADPPQATPPAAAIVPAVTRMTPVAPVTTQPAPRPALVRTVLASVAPVPTHAGITARNPRRTQAVAMLDRSLLSDATIGDLVDGARAESGDRR